jgi:hypothetical protein
VVLRQWRANLALTVDRIWEGGDELAWFASLNPAVTWQFNNGELTWDATFTDRRYDDNSRQRARGYLPGHRIVAGAVFPAAQVRRPGRRAWLLDFQADDDRYGYDGFELLAGLVVKAWPGGTLYARANHRDVQYDDDESVGVARDERERRFAAGFQHDFSAGYLDKWTLGGGIQYTDNDSNISYFSYDRRQVMVNLGRTF